MVTVTIAPSTTSVWIDKMADFESDSMSVRRGATVILKASARTSGRRRGAAGVFF